MNTLQVYCHCRAAGRDLLSQLTEACGDGCSDDCSDGCSEACGDGCSDEEVK